MSLVSHHLSQVHRKGDLGDEVDGMKGDAIMLLNGDDGSRKRGVPRGISQDVCDLEVCIRVLVT